MTTSFNKLVRRRQSPLPFMVRPTYPRELRAWSLMALALGAVEGGVAGVLVKNLFAGHVDIVWLNTAVAIVAGAPAFSNITSFIWASLSQGRDKIRFLLGMQIGTMAGLVMLAFAPLNIAGLLLMTGGAVISRCCWTGVTTLRATVWRANFPRAQMGNMAGRLVRAMTLIMGTTGIVLGMALSVAPESFRLIYPLLAVLGFTGAVTFSRLRVRRQKILLRRERELETREPHSAGMLAMWRVLRDDRDFRRYMRLMFSFGGGNLAMTPILILIMTERYELTQLKQMLITSSIPLLVMTITIPMWSRLLDRDHVIHYRARQSWSFVVTFAVYFVAMALDLPALFWAGAVLHGIGMAGGVLGWNLGHHDFAAPEKASLYMGTHVTLTGIRGLIAPLLGVWLYQLLNNFEPGAGRFVLALPLLVTAFGAWGFVRMSRDMKRRDS
ncbi:MAG TPA: MFS transporter [Gammaproteobacteria bacterium]